MVIEMTPKEITDKYFDWKAKREPWLKYARENYEYYMNDVEGTHTIYTQVQKNTIENTTNIPVTINWLYPAASQKLALMVQSKPGSKVISTDGRYKETALILDKVTRSIMYSSQVKSQNKESLKDTLIMGMGHRMVMEDDIFQPGAFGLRIKHVVPEEVILDANAKDPTLADAEGFFIEKELTETKFLQHYGYLLKDLVDPQGYPVSIDMFIKSSDSLLGRASLSGVWKKILLREYYDLIYSNMYIVDNPETGQKVKIFEENLEEDQKFILSGIEGMPGVYVRKHIIIGDWKLTTRTLPLTKFSLDTMIFEWGGSPYKSYGMIHFAKGMQEAYDKTIQMMILNGILQNNNPWIIPEGCVSATQRPEWENQNPMVAKRFTPIVIQNQIFQPYREPVGQLSNFYPTLSEMLKNGIDKSTGISPILEGDTSSGKIEVFSTLQQYHSAAMQRVIMAIEDVNVASARLGNILCEYIANTMDISKYYYYFDEKGAFNELEVMQELVDNVFLGSYQVIAVEADLMPSQRIANATELYKVAQTSTDPVERTLLTQKAMELSDIKGTEDILEKMDMIKNTQAQLAQMQEQLERDKELLKQYENRALNAEYKTKLMEKLMQSTEAVIRAEEKVTTQLEERGKIESKKAQTANE
jgi:hypothetical protein